MVASSVTPDEPRQIVLQPPDPKEVDTTDWGFFWLGWVFALSWVIGCFRPLCRHPRFPQKQNFRGWIGNVIGEGYNCNFPHYSWVTSVTDCRLELRHPLGFTSMIIILLNVHTAKQLCMQPRCLCACCHLCLLHCKTLHCDIRMSLGASILTRLPVHNYCLQQHQCGISLAFPLAVCGINALFEVLGVVT